MIFAALEGALCRATQFCSIDNQPELEFQALLAVNKPWPQSILSFEGVWLHFYRCIYIF